MRLCVCSWKLYWKSSLISTLHSLSPPPDSIIQLLPGQEECECMFTPLLSGQTGQVTPLKGQEETKASHTLPERKHPQLCVSVMDDSVFCLFVCLFVCFHARDGYTHSPQITTTMTMCVCHPLTNDADDNIFAFRIYNLSIRYE